MANDVHRIANKAFGKSVYSNWSTHMTLCYTFNILIAMLIVQSLHISLHSRFLESFHICWSNAI